jgi:hypothetical protein
VQSNTWLARKSALQERDFADPKLIIVEDMYLYFLFLRQGDFLFSWNVTANWHWRSTSKDNSMMMNETYWLESIERVKLRTKYFGLSQEASEVLAYRDVLRPIVVYVRKRFPRMETLLRIIRKWR